MEDKRKRATGRATMIAANPLNTIPIFMKNPRRERLASAGGAVSPFGDILFLRVLRFRLLRIVSSSVAQSGIRLPRILRAPRREPGNHIRDFLIGHWTSWNIAAPVGRT